MQYVYRVARQVLGWFFLLCALVALMLPMIPQLPFLIAGVLLLAPYVKVFRRASAWLHKKFPNYRGPMRRFRDFKRPFRPARAAAAVPPAVTP